MSGDHIAHKPDCAFMLAIAGSVGIRCKHGYDVCPQCDPCTCGATLETSPFGCPKGWEHWRGEYRGQAGDDQNGYLVIKPRGLKVIFSNGMGWEHVSVSRRGRCPTWDDMCYIKVGFWGEDVTVMQLHPPKAQYINNHEYCLHLWRPLEGTIPMPPSVLVGLPAR